MIDNSLITSIFERVCFRKKFANLVADLQDLIRGHEAYLNKPKQQVLEQNLVPHPHPGALFFSLSFPVFTFLVMDNVTSMRQILQLVKTKRGRPKKGHKT